MPERLHVACGRVNIYFKKTVDVGSVPLQSSAGILEQSVGARNRVGK